MQWILSSEKLPTENREYFVRIDNDYKGIAIWVDGKFWGSDNVLNVTSWLDESPTEGQQEWVRCDGVNLPEIDTAVEVVTEYVSRASGRQVPMWDRFIGFMDEEGDLIVCGSEDSYGWNFKDCVAMWRNLSPLPKPPIQ